MREHERDDDDKGPDGRGEQSAVIVEKQSGHSSKRRTSKRRSYKRESIPRVEIPESITAEIKMPKPTGMEESERSLIFEYINDDFFQEAELEQDILEALEIAQSYADKEHVQEHEQGSPEKPKEGKADQRIEDMSETGAANKVCEPTPTSTSTRKETGMQEKTNCQVVSSSPKSKTKNTADANIKNSSIKKQRHLQSIAKCDSSKSKTETKSDRKAAKRCDFKRSCSDSTTDKRTDRHGILQNTSVFTEEVQRKSHNKGKPRGYRRSSSDPQANRSILPSIPINKEKRRSRSKPKSASRGERVPTTTATERPMDKTLPEAKSTNKCSDKGTTRRQQLSRSNSTDSSFTIISIGLPTTANNSTPSSNEEKKPSRPVPKSASLPTTMPTTTENNNSMVMSNKTLPEAKSTSNSRDRGTTKRQQRPRSDSTDSSYTIISVELPTMANSSTPPPSTSSKNETEQKSRPDSQSTSLPTTTEPKNGMVMSNNKTLPEVEPTSIGSGNSKDSTKRQQRPRSDSTDSNDTISLSDWKKKKRSMQVPATTSRNNARKSPIRDRANTKVLGTKVLGRKTAREEYLKKTKRDSSRTLIASNTSSTFFSRQSREQKEWKRKQREGGLLSRGLGWLQSSSSDISRSTASTASESQGSSMFENNDVVTPRTVQERNKPSPLTSDHDDDDGSIVFMDFPRRNKKKKSARKTKEMTENAQHFSLTNLSMQIGGMLSSSSASSAPPSKNKKRRQEIEPKTKQQQNLDDENLMTTFSSSGTLEYDEGNVFFVTDLSTGDIIVVPMRNEKPIQ